MQFATFRALKGWTLEQAAAEMRAPGRDRLGKINAAMISRHERGKAFPHPELVARYAEVTDGAVTYQDWLAVREEARTLPDNALPTRQVGRKRKEVT